MLASPLPMVMLWGRAGYMIYNDAYSKFAGGRHPYLLGSPVELGWPEVADFNRHVVDTCLAGGTLSFRNKVLVLLRDGVPEDVWLDLYYSPVANDDGHSCRRHGDGGGNHRVCDLRTPAPGSGRRLPRRQRTGATGTECRRVAWLVCLGREKQHAVGDERFARTFSYPPDQDLSNLAQDIAESRIHPDDHGWVQERVAHSVQTGEPYNAEYRVQRSDGSYLWVLASGGCEFDEHGEAVALSRRVDRHS